MKQVLIQIRPFDAVTNARTDIYVADGANGEAFGVSGRAWSPAILTRPQLSFEFFSLDMDGRIQAGRAQFTLLVDALTDSSRPRELYWNGAEVSIWFDSAREAAGAVPDFMGLITQAPLDRNSGRLSVTAEVPITDIDKPLLTKSFTGNGGIGGDIGKRGVLLPAGFGSVKNIEPIWFDLVRNIGSIDGYGNTVSIDWLGEGLSSFGPRVNNYATYAALAAAIDDGTIRPGQWGTCVAEGLVGLGAPPAGVITVHAVFGANRVGAMIRRIAETHLGMAIGRIDTTSLTALDAAVNRATHYWTAEQRNAKDLIEAIARSCNATPLISAQRLLTVTRAVSSAPVATLDRSGSTEPRVIRWRPGQPDAPFSKIKARAARPARVLRNDEVNYVDTLIERGSYDPAEIYRAGNIVELPDGSRWIYSAAVPSSGNAPFAGSAFWGNHVSATEPDWTALRDSTGTRPENNATRNDDGVNMIRSPLILDEVILTNGAVLATYAGAPAIQLFTANALGRWGPKVPCRPSETLFHSFLLSSDGGGSNTVNASYTYFDANGAAISAVNLSSLASPSLSSCASITTTITFSFQVPSTAYFIQIYIERPVASGNSFFVRQPYLGRSAPGATVGAEVGKNLVGSDGAQLVPPATNLLYNSRFEAGLDGWALYYNSGTSLSLTGAGKLRVSWPTPAAGWTGGSFGPMDNSAIRAGRRIFKVLPGQRYAARLRSAVSGSCNRVNAYCRFLNQALTAEITGFWANNVLSGSTESSGYGDVPAGAYWLEMEVYGVTDGLTGAGAFEIEAMALWEIPSNQTVVPQFSDGPPAIYRATRGAILDANPEVGNFRLGDGGILTPDRVLTELGTAASYTGRTQVETAIFDQKQNRVYNSQFKYNLAGWGGHTDPFVLYNDYAGTYVSAPLGTGGVKVLVSSSPINCAQNVGMTLSATFRGDASPLQFAFVDVEWRNGGNGALIGYSSTAANLVFWSNINTQQNRKSQTFSTPFATDGSAFVKAIVRVVTNSDVAVSYGELLVTKIQLELGWAPTIYNEGADDGAVLGRTTGQIPDSRSLNASNTLGLVALSSPGALGDTVISGQLYLTIGAGTYYTDWGGTVTYPSATIGPGPFGLTYHIWRNVSGPGDAGSSYDASPTLTNALGVGKVYLGSVIARASAGDPPGPSSNNGDYVDNGGGIFIPN